MRLSFQINIIQIAFHISWIFIFSSLFSGERRALPHKVITHIDVRANRMCLNFCVRKGPKATANIDETTHNKCHKHETIYRSLQNVLCFITVIQLLATWILAGAGRVFFLFSPCRYPVPVHNIFW